MMAQIGMFRPSALLAFAALVARGGAEVRELGGCLATAQQFRE